MDEGNRDVTAQVTLARKRLQNARSALDLAVGALADLDAGEMMAPSSLLLLLVDAVRAKQNLDKLEALVPSKLA